MLFIKEKKKKRNMTVSYEVKHRVSFLAVKVINHENYLWIWCFPI